jgi:hypothetical protein
MAKERRFSGSSGTEEEEAVIGGYGDASADHAPYLYAVYGALSMVGVGHESSGENATSDRDRKLHPLPAQPARTLALQRNPLDSLHVVSWMASVPASRGHGPGNENALVLGEDNPCMSTERH